MNFLLHKKKRSVGGFTLIETLVAIAILMTVIAAPLTAANKGLGTALNARDQLTASLLAQDVVEYVKNIKSVNFAEDPDTWLDGLSGCTENSICRLDSTRFFGTVGSGITQCGVAATSVDSCPVWIDNSGYRQPDPGGNSSQSAFNRGFYLVGQPVGSTTKRKIYVIVSWVSGGTRHESTLSAGISKVNW
jgi:prepilin-type N-terminal cleavage/methylation domain-containing protein